MNALRTTISAYSVSIDESAVASWIRLAYGSHQCWILEKEFT